MKRVWCGAVEVACASCLSGCSCSGAWVVACVVVSEWLVVWWCLGGWLCGSAWVVGCVVLFEWLLV